MQMAGCQLVATAGRVFRVKPIKRARKEGREKSYCGRTDVFLSPLDSVFITSLNFKAAWHTAGGRFSQGSSEAVVL